MAEFDPYYKWLGILPAEQPPNHYRLLGIELFESDPDVIDAAADQRMTFLRTCAGGTHVAESQRLLNEVSQARLCLLNPANKTRFDVGLKAKLRAANPRSVPAHPAAVAGTTGNSPHAKQPPLDSERAVPQPPSAAGQETKRPTDSVPMMSGSFANLPARFGRYEVEKLLGRGNMGAVYLARDTQLGRNVALKIPKVSASGSKKLLQRLATEANAAARLDHHGVCKVYECSAIDGTCYIAMQFIEGETLKSQLKKRSKTPSEAVSLMLQLAEPLAEAHDLGIIHRDLKPENVMINRRGLPVIMDFGLAKIVTVSGDAAHTQAGMILGSPAYMSPEQALGEASQVTGQTDIYALGVIFYELLTGQWPFSGAAMQIMGQKSVQAPPSPVSVKRDLNPRLAAICHKMIARNKADRYQTLHAVIADLRTIDVQASDLAGKPVGAEAATLSFTGVADERLASLIARNTRKRPDSEHQIKAAAARWSQSLLAWWRRRTPPVRWAALGGAAAAMLVFSTVLLFPTKYGVVEIEINDPHLSVRFEGETITMDNDGRPIRVTATARHTLEVLLDGVTVESATRELILKRDEKRPVKISLLKGEVIVDDDQKSEKKPSELNSRVPSKAVAEGTNPDKTGWHGWPADAPPPAIAPFGAIQAKKHQAAWAKYLQIDVEYTNSVGMKFVLIPPGEFMMGSAQEEIEEALNLAGGNTYWQDHIKCEAPQHNVILTQPIYLGVNEVTQADYETVMGKNPSHFAPTGAGKDAVAGMDTTAHPVEMVSWNDAVEFCAKLSQREKLKPFYFRTGETVTPLDGTGYRSPTEAEWEFACRAGTTTKYWIGNEDEGVVRVGWFSTNCGGRTHAVGELKANPFGLYDVHGNIWEWVQDWWEPKYYGHFQEKRALNPNGPSIAGSQRAYRGGSWPDIPASWCRASVRAHNPPTLRTFNVGFRVSLVVGAAEKAMAERVTKPASAAARSSKAIPVKKLPAPSSALAAFRREDIPQDALAAAGDGDPQRAPASLVGVLGEAQPIHTGVVFGLAYSPDGRWLASGSNDTTIMLRDTVSGDVKRVLRGHTGPVSAVAFSKDGSTLVSASHDGTLRLWGVEKEEQPIVVEANLDHPLIHAMAVSPDGRFVAAGGESGLIKLWKWGEWQKPIDFPALNGKVKIRTLGFSPDGELLACAGVEENEKKTASRVYIYSTDDGALKGSMSLDSRIIFALSFSHDGKRLAAVGGHVNGRVWDVASGKSIMELARMCYGGEWNDAFSVAWSPDDKLLAAGARGRVTVYEIPTGGKRTVCFSFDQAVHAVRFNSRGDRLAAGGARADVQVWDTANWTLKYVDHGHRHHVHCVAVSRDAREILSLGDEMVLLRWQLARPRKPIVNPLEFGESILLALPYSASYNEDGKTCVISCAMAIATRNKVTNKETVFSTQPMYVLNSNVSSDGRRVAGSGVDGHLHLWDVALGRNVHTYPIKGRWSGVAFSDDGGLLASCNGETKRITVWNVASGAEVASWEVPSVAKVAAFQRDGETLATGHEDGAIVLWNPANGQKKTSFGGHTPSAVYRLKFTADGKTLISSGNDGAIRLWDLEQERAKEVIPLGPAKRPLTFDVDPSGQFIIAAGDSPLIYILKLPKPVESAMKSPAEGAKDKTVRTSVAGVAAPTVASVDSRDSPWSAAKKAGEQWDENDLKMKFCWCPPGTFKMGSPRGELQRGDDENQVHVTLTRGFWLGKYEVTQAEWVRLMGHNPSAFSFGGTQGGEVAGVDTNRFPVENVSWEQASAFCEKLTGQERQAGQLPAGWEYRLPTEAQWEYACRAGTMTPFSFGRVFNGEQAKCDGNEPYGTAQHGPSSRKTAERGAYSPNAFGLCDMHGNVWEWCRDWRQEKLPGGLDPEVAETASNRVFRGGSWFSGADKCRSANRDGDEPAVQSPNLGFRVAAVQVK